MTTPRLGAPELVSGQATPETTVNEQIRYIEAGSGHFIFKDRDLATPPGSPADGDCYFIAGGTTPTGAWAGKAGKIAFRVNTAWEFITPIDGFTAIVVDESRLLVGYNSGTTVWDTLSSPSGAYQPLDADLTAIAGLVDPNADRILFWDDSAGTWAHLTVGTGLSISGTTLTATASGASTTQTGEQISGFISSPSNKSYTIALDMKHAGTITEVTTKSASGTCTATWKINSTALGGTANSVSSTETTQAHASSNAFAAGDDIVLTVSSNSSCADMSFTIKYTRTLA